MKIPTISVQSYSVRDQMTRNAVGTLDRLARIGLTAVEPFDVVDRPAARAQEFAAAGLRTPTVHSAFLSRELSLEGSTLTVPEPTVVFDAARALGAEILIDPRVDPSRWTRREDIVATASRLNELAAAARDYGLTLGYHNHRHELTTRIGGRTALEVFADSLDDGIVLEIDCYWVVAAGEDCSALLGRLGSRVRALHVKDGPLEADVLDQRPVGQGRVQWPEILAAARHAEYLVIEFDRYDGDLFEGISNSYRYLADWAARRIAPETPGPFSDTARDASGRENTAQALYPDGSPHEKAER